MLQLHDDQKVEPLLCAVCGTENLTVAKACSSCGTTLLDGRSRAGVVSALPAGTVLQNGQYSLSGVLGQGGFGITYRGHDAGLDRAVAIKEFYPSGCSRFGHTVLPADTQDAAAYNLAKARFVEEARTLARFRHPGIVDVYAVFEENDTAYMVMEYVAGQTLLQMVEARGMLPENEGVSLITRAGEALAAVHENGMLHRDLKPANMILRDDGNVVLIDFGTARAFAPDTTRRMTTTITPGYAPLEQYGQQARFGAFTDIYALGATLYHLLTGQAPVQAPDRASGVDLVEPRTLNPKLSRRVNDAIVWALKINVKERPQSVHEFLESLKPEKTEPAPARQSQTAPRPQPARNFAEPTPAPKIDVTSPSPGESIAQMQLRREQEANGLRPAAPPVAAPSTPAVTPPGTAAKPDGWGIVILLWGALVVLTLAGMAAWILHSTQPAPYTPPPSLIPRPVQPVVSRKFEPVTEKVVLQQQAPGEFYPFKISPDASIIVGAPNGLGLKLWDTKTGQQVDRFSYHLHTRALAFYPDSKSFVGLDNTKETEWSQLYVVSVADGSQRWMAKFPPKSRLIGPLAIAQPATASSPTKSQVIVACGNILGQIALFDAQGKPFGLLSLKSINKFSKEIISMAVSADGRLLAAAAQGEGTSNVVQVWNLVDRRTLITIVSDPVDQLAIAPDGTLAVLLKSSAIKIWNTHSGTSVQTIERHEGANEHALRFSPDGAQLAVANDWFISLHKAPNFAEPETRYVHVSVPPNRHLEVADIAFTSNGESVIFVTYIPPAFYRWNLKQLPEYSGTISSTLAPE